MAIHSDSAWLLSISACACAAIGVAAYGLGTGAMTVPLAAGGMMALGTGLLLSQLRDYVGRDDANIINQERRHIFHRLDRIDQQNRGWEEGQRNLSQQMTALQSEAYANNATVSRGLEDIRQAHAAVAQKIETLMSRPPVMQTVYATPEPAVSYASDETLATNDTSESAAESTQTAAEDDTPFGRRLTLSLEPIVDLYSQQTAHYRLVASMLDTNGNEIAPELFAHFVAQQGQRSVLDAFIVRETLGILAQLRLRDPNLCVLVPIGAATLADPHRLQTILDDIAMSPGASAGLVLDINHAVLASLPDASLEGLAVLARKGVALALSQASISGVDLSALSKLNVRYVCLAAASLALGTRTPSAVSGFIHAARAMRIQTVITQVTEPQALAEIMRSARLACGPAFAPPRRLKRSADDATGMAAAA
jgi:EAL domain-containing protein (putative c-di-GMP-specific phosphodiesterase class I)